MGAHGQATFNPLKDSALCPYVVRRSQRPGPASPSLGTGGPRSLDGNRVDRLEARKPIMGLRGP